MATVNKPGGIISGIDVPEWNVEDEITNSRLTIVMDPIIITDGDADNPIVGTVSLYYDYFDLVNGVNVRYPIVEATNVTLNGLS